MSKKQEQTGNTLWYLIEIVGLPYSLHSDNYNIFKEELFKIILRKFDILSLCTEPH